jgi:hypothetical protein
MRNLCLLSSALMFMGASAQAQAVLQGEIGLYEQSIDSRSAICGVDFTFVFRDDVYGATQLGGTTGSVSYAVVNGGVVTMFKVAASSGADRIQVHSASIKAKDQILRPSQIECQDKRNFCGAFYNQDVTKIMVALSTESLEVRYNLMAGGIDFAFPISIHQAKNFDNLQEFNNCILGLLNGLHD